VAAGRKTFQLFGASMGGLTAQHVAVLHPGRLTRLILAATGPGATPPSPRSPRRPPHFSGGARGRRPRPTAWPAPSSTRALSARASRVHRRGGGLPGRPPDPGTRLHRPVPLLPDADIGDRLGEIDVPALVLHGTEDVLVPLANAEALTKLLPGARRYWFDGCGHLFFTRTPT